jgi:hypothetical protein
MRLDEGLWRKHQYAVLVSFIHHLAYWRCSSRVYADVGRKSEFWVRTIDAHLLRAVIDWCMVFGADSNQVHWKKTVPDLSAQRGCRKRLLADAALKPAQWDAYWNSMTTFRNDFAAHRVAAARYPAVPRMETAFRIATAYDQWLRDTLCQENLQDAIITTFDCAGQLIMRPFFGKTR